MIDLHYWPTPNGKKVTILLEECGLPYKIVPVNIGRGDQFSKEFLEMNPNHRMPVMVDHEPKGGGKPIALFESGAIMMYIAEKAGKFYPQDLRTKHDVNQWLIWQMANQGPKSGECGHFRRVDQAKEGDQKYAVTRFTDEVNRLYGVLNNQLYKHRYLAGDQYTIADMICYPWTINWKFQGQDIEEFKHFKRWFEELGAQARGAEGHGGRRRSLGRQHQAAARGAGPHPQDALQPARPAGTGVEGAGVASLAGPRAQEARGPEEPRPASPCRWLCRTRRPRPSASWSPPSRPGSAGLR